MPKLRIRKNNRWEETKFEDDTFSIGREADNHLVIESFFVSRKHCEIKKDEQGFFLEDLGSKVGVQVNNRPVKGKVRLKSGDLLTFADKFEAMFLDTKEQTVTTTLVAQDADESFTGAVLTGLDGPTNGQVFGLDKNITKVGRNPVCDVCIPTHTISQSHAEIVREKRHFILTDLGSVNGSFVNNTRVHRQQLENGDLVRFDWVSFRFHTMESLRREGQKVPGTQQPKPVLDQDPNRTRPVDMTEQAAQDGPPPLPEAAKAQANTLHRDPEIAAHKPPIKPSNLSLIIALLLLAGAGIGCLVAAYFVWQWLF